MVPFYSLLCPKGKEWNQQLWEGWLRLYKDVLRPSAYDLIDGKNFQWCQMSYLLPAGSCIQLCSVLLYSILCSIRIKAFLTLVKLTSELDNIFCDKILIDSQGKENFQGQDFSAPLRKAAFVIFASSNQFCLFLHLIWPIMCYVLIRQTSILLYKIWISKQVCLKKQKNP